MTTPDFTTVIAIDNHTIQQFRQVWPLWKKFAPVLMEHPMLVIRDAGLSGTFLDGPPHRRVLLWNPPWLGVSQRERMLGSFVKAVPGLIETPYWLKIDVDAYPTRLGFQIDPDWFKGDPVLISNPWGYTKPGLWINQLEEWAEGVPDLARHPPLGLRCPEGVLRFGHRRIISWLCFVRTDWSRRVAAYCPDRLPVPSQDTYHWYCAARTREMINKVRFKQHGWIHSRRPPDPKLLEGCK